MSPKKLIRMVGNTGNKNKEINQAKSLTEILDGSLADVNEGKDFIGSFIILRKDQAVISQKMMTSKGGAIDLQRQERIIKLPARYTVVLRHPEQYKGICAWTQCDTPDF